MATTTTTHKTRRGELMAKLDGKKIGAGHYAIRGYEAKMIREASGSKPGLWAVTHEDAKAFEAANLTEVLEVINLIFSPASAPAEQPVVAEVTSETAPAEVEVIIETPAPVVPEVPAEPVVVEVQEDVAPAPAPKKAKTTKSRTPKTRRTELLEKLGARTLDTAEYAVAGHHVEYVAPGVMPRNAGGRWRTTLLSDEGVVVSWNLSLTAALEVVESRVAEGQAETAQTENPSNGVREYVAVYPSSSTDVDLCELHAPGCADLDRTAKKTDPQVAVSFDITDEDAAMLVLDPDELGYDMHSVKVMPCAQHAPLAVSTNA